MSTKNILIFIIFALSLQACREEFFLDSINHENLLVVEGFVTNEPGPYTIKLSQSAQTNKPQFIPFSNCIVSLHDNAGFSEVLEETKPGQYTTSEEGFQGVIGNEYRLSVITEEGEEYETGFQELKELIEIDSIYAKLNYMINIEYPFGLPGYEFYVDTKIAPKKENYFLWNMTETYEYDIDYKLAYVETRFGDYIYSNPRYDTLQTCWNTEKVRFFYTGKTANLSLAKITNKPLHFVGTESKRLTKRYTVLINQYTINQKAFSYWENIENQISNENFLSTNQPYNIVGNLKNINDPEELVLGYFTVASISKKRIFVDKPKVTFYNSSRYILTNPIAISDYKRSHPAPYFWVAVEEGTYGLTYKECVDCRNEGGVLNKPDFWIDK